MTSRNVIRRRTNLALIGVFGFIVLAIGAIVLTSPPSSQVAGVNDIPKFVELK